jgi:hypothetical protein
MAASSVAALFCLQETKTFVFLKEQSDEPLLISTDTRSQPTMSLNVVLKRAFAGIRCIFLSKSTRAPGIVFFASLLTMQVIFPSSKLPDAANIFASNFFLCRCLHRAYLPISNPLFDLLSSMRDFGSALFGLSTGSCVVGFCD